MADQSSLKFDCSFMASGLNRVQCKVELARRNALPPNSGTDCGLCRSEVESCCHLFFGCSISWKVWQKILIWIGTVSVLPMDAKSHFLQFRALLGVDPKSLKALSLVSVASISAIWYYRNAAIFKNEEVAVEKIFDLIQFRSWFWLKAKEKDFFASNHEWASNISCCLSYLS